MVMYPMHILKNESYFTCVSEPVLPKAIQQGKVWSFLTCSQICPSLCWAQCWYCIWNTSIYNYAVTYAEVVTFKVMTHNREDQIFLQFLYQCLPVSPISCFSVSETLFLSKHEEKIPQSFTGLSSFCFLWDLSDFTQLMISFSD